MEAKTEFTKMETKSGYWLRRSFSAGVLLLISGIIKAGDPVVNAIAKDSLLKDTANAASKGSGGGGIEDNPVLKYSLMAIGIIVIIGFAFITSVRKNKPASGGPVGYRKGGSHHKHQHKI